MRMLHHSRTITVIGKNWLRPVFFGVENKYKNEVWFFLPFRGQVDTKREKVLTNKELAVSTCGVNLCQFGFYGHKIDDVEIFTEKRTPLIVSNLHDHGVKRCQGLIFKWTPIKMLNIK